MLCLTAMLTLLLACLSEPLPLEHLRHLDWQRGMRPGERCPKKCQPELCPDARLLQSCVSGQVRDPCGCCWECGNGEGQLCDPEPWTGSTFFGRCAEGLRCKAPRRDPSMKEEPKPVCVCTKQEMLCSSDGKTYENVCQLRAAQRRLGERQKVTVAHHGPCKAKPIITYAPRDIITLEGSDVLLSCEVSSYPLASIQWRKEGDSVFLTADDSSRAIQARGGPRRFELTGWLQIHGVGPDDAGVYTCAARNAFGEVSASARLRVMHRGSPQNREIPKRKNEAHNTSFNDAESEDDEDYEGQPSGYMYL
ncbi:kazal-type serine peptidase inhibitor domain 2 [Pygocentrus nattereri]|uniref:Kazal-type serine peptidase inhibitor domain 3 n=1 Tax=Pygocentrus nattereri TaxID=42514 RepID=A0A3B4EMR9_PYGNA|nr:kazal-type serine peptidase inhibitor domain 2 [Pygocentrus nattereri]XP_017545275.1 kazal-type serine peptidase inhibitor domain 2 [Pygocentrus nattereri]XP_017545280.1 kazal-type serine peptidase inhibitor domain 2 [Pygocentrus nattereri]XP_037396242.1 kazal-type serine peptidase inhibitor domain 2 [Pygocentrus nattereri]XP_037396243.1 kazal-type serine peptidase inhibitor domain 2 [Pygocentrus nattereri]XP_037396244.1 kazal-type serine peptidase inhibitor domain 2 [Pygocentrus nattereri]